MDLKLHSPELSSRFTLPSLATCENFRELRQLLTSGFRKKMSLLLGTACLPSFNFMVLEKILKVSASY